MNIRRPSHALGIRRSGNQPAPHNPDLKPRPAPRSAALYSPYQRVSSATVYGGGLPI